MRSEAILGEIMSRGIFKAINSTAQQAEAAKAAGPAEAAEPAEAAQC